MTEETQMKRARIYFQPRPLQLSGSGRLSPPGLFRLRALFSVISVLSCSTLILLASRLASPALAADSAADFAFVHPGLLHTREDLTRMSNAVAAKQEPITAGYQVLRSHAQSKLDYKMRRPFEEVGRVTVLCQCRQRLESGWRKPGCLPGGHLRRPARAVGPAGRWRGRRRGRNGI